jgi:hypothetical protein
MLDCLSVSLSHCTFCTFFPLLPSNTCFLPPRSYIFLSLAFSLPRYSGTSSVIHLSYFLLYLDSLIFSLVSCLSVYLPLSLSSTFIHRPFALNLSTSSLTYPFLSPLLLRVLFFLSSIPSVSCTLLFHPFCLQTLPLSFSLSLSAYSFCTLHTFCEIATFINNQM